MKKERYLKYINGNRLIVIDTITGTKYRFKPEEDNSPYQPIFPENIDINISYSCNMNCSFCYIDANKKGKIATKENIKKVFNILKDAPSGIELAINLNSSKDSIKVLLDFLDVFKNKFIINVTTRFDLVNFLLLKDLQNKDLIKGIGVSLDKNKEMEQIKATFNYKLKNVNFHTINGINNINNIINKIKNINLLILGYKQIGRGKNNLPKLIQNWEEIFNKAKENNITLIFDNLCIEQIKNTNYKFTKEIWDKRYLGEDGSSSCYIDIVTLKASKNSIIFNQNNFNILNFNSIKEIFKQTQKIF